MYVKVAGLAENRDIEVVREFGSDRVQSLAPVPQSERHFIILELPEGVEVQAQVSSEDYGKIAKLLEPVPKTFWERL
jgi:hypothetical protein